MDLASAGGRPAGTLEEPRGYAHGALPAVLADGGPAPTPNALAQKVPSTELYIPSLAVFAFPSLLTLEAPHDDPRYVLASIESAGGPEAAVVYDDTVHELPGGPSMRTVLDDWPGWTGQIESAIAAGRPGRGVPVRDVQFAAPLPEPRNLYMAGANYADHAREMSGLPRDAPIARPLHGPFFFLKPTSTVVGPDSAVVLPHGTERLDREVELAAVIGTPARNLPGQHALDCVAGYTVINDVSVRDWFKREPAPGPPMAFDWFTHKGWATTCPMG